MFCFSFFHSSSIPEKYALVEMSVSQVLLSADAYLVCLSHALSTEKEEIMGLLIGEVKVCSQNMLYYRP